MIERVLLMSMSLMLASCFSTPLSPHKIDVQQGNYVDQDMVAKLKPGMTRSQVRFVLGTPLVADPFHGNRWDYVYRMQKNGGPPEERKITIVFEGDKLARVDGDIVPGDIAEDAKSKVSKAAPPRSLTGAADPAKKAEERSLKEKVEALIAEKEAQGKDDSELRKSLAKLLGVEERDISDLPRAKAVSGREKAPPEPRQAKSDLPKSKKVSAQKKVAKAKSEEKAQAAGEEPGKGIRASGFSADVLSALGVRYEGDGKGSEQEAEVEETDDEGQPAKKRKTVRKSGLKADGLSADILRTLGVGFEGDGSENASEDDEEVAEGAEKPAKEEKAGVLDELKNAEGKSVKQQLSEKFGIGGGDEKKKRGDAEDASGDEEVAGKPTFMDDVRTVIGLGPAEKGTGGKSEKLAKKSAREDVEEGDVEEEEDETPEKPTFWEDVRTVIGLD